jgi:hypothetical protein
MSNGTLTKVTTRTAAEVCRRFVLGDEARKLLRDNQTPRQFLDLLAEKGQLADALRFLAYALPKREAVWWGCQCLRQVAAGNQPPATLQAVQSAEKWASNPGEDQRRAGKPAAEAAGLETPAGCTALAAFYSGGSLAPPSAPPVPPGEHLTHKGVALAVLQAAVLTEPAKATEKYRRFLALGIDVGNGVNRWKEAK